MRSLLQGTINYSEQKAPLPAVNKFASVRRHEILRRQSGRKVENVCPK